MLDLKIIYDLLANYLNSSVPSSFFLLKSLFRTPLLIILSPILWVKIRFFYEHFIARITYRITFSFALVSDGELVIRCSFSFSSFNSYRDFS